MKSRKIFKSSGRPVLASVLTLTHQQAFCRANCDIISLHPLQNPFLQGVRFYTTDRAAVLKGLVIGQKQQGC